MLDIADIACEDGGIAPIQRLDHDHSVYDISRFGVTEEPAYLTGYSQRKLRDFADAEEIVQHWPDEAMVPPTALYLCIDCGWQDKGISGDVCILAQCTGRTRSLNILQHATGIEDEGAE